MSGSRSTSLVELTAGETIRLPPHLPTRRQVS
jgi:hypothetical protein